MIYANIRYYKLYCPHCGYNWKTVFHNGLHLGSPQVKCTRCDQLFATGWKEWSAFTTSERRRFLFVPFGILGFAWLAFAVIPIYFAITISQTHPFVEILGGYSAVAALIGAVIVLILISEIATSRKRDIAHSEPLISKPLTSNELDFSSPHEIAEMVERLRSKR
jgi:hypothetical protein